MPSNILLYGKGIFTTIAFRNGELYLWEKHWRRLIANAAQIGIDISRHSETSVKDAALNQIGNLANARGRVRVSFLDESTTELWDGGETHGTSLSIVCGQMRQVPSDLSVTISPYLLNSTSPLAGVKSCNYLEQLMALDEAKARGFNEAIRSNERGEVASGCMANVFWMKDGKMYTPSLRTGCLSGTTREYILENLECEEVEVPVQKLFDAEAIFLTSAGLGVAAAARFNGSNLQTDEFAITNFLPY